MSSMSPSTFLQSTLGLALGYRLGITGVLKPDWLCKGAAGIFIMRAQGIELSIQRQVHNCGSHFWCLPMSEGLQLPINVCIINITSTPPASPCHSHPYHSHPSLLATLRCTTGWDDTVGPYDRRHWLQKLASTAHALFECHGALEKLLPIWVRVRSRVRVQISLS